MWNLFLLNFSWSFVRSGNGIVDFQEFSWNEMWCINHYGRVCQKIEFVPYCTCAKRKHVVARSSILLIRLAEWRFSALRVTIRDQIHQEQNIIVCIAKHCAAGITFVLNAIWLRSALWASKEGSYAKENLILLYPCLRNCLNTYVFTWENPSHGQILWVCLSIVCVRVKSTVLVKHFDTFSIFFFLYFYYLRWCLMFMMDSFVLPHNSLWYFIAFNSLQYFSTL